MFRKLIKFSKYIDHVCALLHSQSEIGLHVNLIDVTKGIHTFVILFTTLLKYMFISILCISQQKLRLLPWYELNCALCSELNPVSFFQKLARYTWADEEG